MIKICVFSDSHGCADNMLSVLRMESPDLFIHLGDGETDLDTVRASFPDLPYRHVRGNCDWTSSARSDLRLTLNSVRIFAVHGHTYDVKYDPYLTKLKYAAMEAQADIVLFGHTHRAVLRSESGLEIMNPGTIGAFSNPSYGIITVYDDNSFQLCLRSLR